MPGAFLPEVSESEATGTVAEVYEDIRRVFGLPLVNLVYRHLAATPGRLEETWGELRPNLAHPGMDAAAEELGAIPSVVAGPIPAAALAAAGVGARQLSGAIATLVAYNYANPRNLLAIHALLAGSAGADHPLQEATERARPGEQPELLPMADLRRLDGPVLALLEEMAAPFSSSGEAVLVPGLFRHFAGEPQLLALLWTGLSPLVRGRGLAREGNLVAARARALAGTLPYPVIPIGEPETRRALERFAFTIPQMIVAGVALRRGLPEPA